MAVYKIAGVSSWRTKLFWRKHGGPRPGLLLRRLPEFFAEMQLIFREIENAGLDIELFTVRVEDRGEWEHEAERTARLVWLAVEAPREQLVKFVQLYAGIKDTSKIEEY